MSRYTRPRRTAAAEPPTPEVLTWDILIIDVVGYSELSIDQQVRTINQLTYIVRESRTIGGTGKAERLFLPTGDGMAIGFRGAPEKPLRLASEIHRAYEATHEGGRYLLKMGIHSGIAFRILDINRQKNIAGSGINMAARTLSCCSPGHILVADQPGKDLSQLDAWKERLHGPYHFTVKHRKSLTAFNLFDKSDRIGLSEEPTLNRTFEPAYTPLLEHLHKLGIGPNQQLRHSSVVGQLGRPLVVDSVIVDLPISGFLGVPPEHIRVHMLDTGPVLPECVAEAKRTINDPKESNKPKVYIGRWVAPLSDQGDFLSLYLGRTDYWTSLAVDKAASQLKHQIEEGMLDMGRFPRRLALHVAVITADRQLLLCRRTADVQYEPLCWAATFEENLDADMDCDSSGKIDLREGVRRGLKEELGLPVDIRESAVINFVALGLEWDILAEALITVVTLPRSELAEVKDYVLSALDQEHGPLSSVSFSLDACFDLLNRDHYDPPGQPGAAYRWHRTSRFRILAALFSEYGYGSTLQFIQKRAEVLEAVKKRE